MNMDDFLNWLIFDFIGGIAGENTLVFELLLLLLGGGIVFLFVAVLRLFKKK